MSPKPIKKHQRPAVLSEEMGYIRLPVVLELFPIGEATWFRGIKAGRYPRGVKLGPRVTAWRVADIQKLLAAAADDAA